jgi:hypothetical protein
MNAANHTSLPSVERARPHLGTSPRIPLRTNLPTINSPLYRRDPPGTGSTNPPPGGNIARRPRPAPVAPARSRAGDRLRRFTFTLNNYTQVEYDSICATDCRWMICAKETGDEGTPHLQGACILLTQKSFTAVKAMPGFTRAHIEVMRGTPEQNKEYCTKQDTNAYEKGDFPQPGKLRSKLTKLINRRQTKRHTQDVRRSSFGCLFG